MLDVDFVAIELKQGSKYFWSGVLVYLEEEDLTGEMILEEYAMIYAASHIIKLKMDLKEWKEYRLKEFNKVKRERDEQLDMEKMQYVFEDVDTVYIHKQRVQLLVRPNAKTADMDQVISKIPGILPDFT